MQREYVRKIEGVFRVGDTRVSLDSLGYLFREGMSAESMVESYPGLTLEQVHGALAFYLGNRKEVDAYLAEARRSRNRHPDRGRCGLEGLMDPDVLRISADSGRILVSQERRTMPSHFARYTATASSHGVVLLREAIPIATAIEELLLI